MLININLIFQFIRKIVKGKIYMKLGIYVGSFNPVHNGHLKVINYLLDNNLVDKVLVLATPNYWNKQDLIDVKDRINMLKYFETDNIIIDSIHNNYPYTYQVIDSIKKDYKDELYLIIGSDNLEKLYLWKNIDKILENKIIVFRRGREDINKLLERYPIDRFIVVDDFDYLNICSTDIRNGKENDIDSKVLQYIKKNNLYKIEKE